MGDSHARRRSAPRAERSSDVTRWRGLWQASLLAAVLALVVVVAASGRDALRGAPGPLSTPHARAGLDCAGCHGSARDRPTVQACTGCHGERAHVRPGHARAAAAGELRCADCHREHRDHGGISFAADGTVTRYGVGATQNLRPAGGSGYRPPEPLSVAVIPAAACMRCHRIDEPRDPAAACVLHEQRALGPARPTLCFDEHRQVAAHGGHRQIRDTAWEATRELLAQAPLTPGATTIDSGGGRGTGRPLLWILLALACGLLLWLGPRALLTIHARRIARRQRQQAAVVAPPRERKLPTINTSTCIGCYACVDACPYDVLAIRDYLAVVARPADCCGLTLCEQRCPNGSLRMGDGVPVNDSPLAGDDLQSSDVPGLYLAGDVTGLPLIRNAINQGAHAVRALARELARTPDAPRALDSGDMLDVIIIGAGPAGLSAALAAHDAGLRYTVLEQSTVAASIRSFPRGKLVFDQPLELPLIGDLWLQEASKEELLGQWLRIVGRHQLDIREHHRVTAVTPLPAPTDEPRASHGFAVTAVAESDDPGQPEEVALRARRVVVAIGRRGSPRRLPVEIPEPMAEHLHYSLADARSFAGRRVLVVGLGDVAMEAALALAQQPGTQVTVAYRGDGFRRGKARTIDALRRHIDTGGIDLRLSTEVAAVRPGAVELTTPDGSHELPCDALFVLIGAIPPTALLRRFGLRVADPEA